MHTATRGPGRRKQHYSASVANMEAAQVQPDRRSVLSASSIPSKVYIKEDRSITIKDIKLIMPTLLILLFTIFVMVTVIPYAFSSVIKQLKAVHALEAAAEAATERTLSDVGEVATNMTESTDEVVDA
eukprot:TRINITY_DN14217_c0_g1_i2.p1 TRINITY_DN14217_c0_g1~~TRINITY_DN14217_c0_g1_i2.p1  ORF type:complete len:128 (+),score=53.67 TRINITY_DN14217_c0_g1_i2:82-465(+)